MKRIQSMIMGLAVVGLVLSPMSADAASPSAGKKKEQRLLKQLKRLPAGNTPPAKVKSIALPLVKLAPERGQRYYKIAVLKYAAAFVQSKASFLAKKFRAQVDRSGLPGSRKRQIKNQITKIERRVTNPNVNPTPTPVPVYQAGGFREPASMTA